MHEIALHNHYQLSIRRNRYAYFAEGSPVEVMSNRNKRRKWLEICCGLPKKFLSMSKAEQDKSGYNNIPGWKHICEAWTLEAWEYWFEHDRPTKSWPLGRLMTDLDHPQRVWDHVIEPTGLLAFIPYAPESDVRAYDTYLWSENARKNHFVVTVEDDADVLEVESIGKSINMDYDSGAVIHNSEYSEPDERIVTVKRLINYQEMGLSGRSIERLNDLSIVCNPRFDKPVDISRFNFPKLHVAKSALRVT